MTVGLPTDPLDSPSHVEEHEWVRDTLTNHTHDLEDLGQVMIAGPTDGQVLTYDSLSSSWVNVDLPTDGGGSSGGSGGGLGDRYLIATPDAPTAVRDAADLDLGSVSNVATSLQTALNANSRVLIWGPTINFPTSGSVTVTNAVDILSFGTQITLPPAMPTPSSSRPAGLKITGTRTQLTGWALPSTLSYGDYKLAFSTLPSEGLAVGDWINIRTTNQNNQNRPAEYVKGEIVQVVAISGTTVTIGNTLRDDYLVDGTLQLYKLGMLQNVVVDGLHVRAHPSATTQAEIFAIQSCERPIIRNCKVSGAAGYYGLGVFYSVYVLVDNLHASGVYDKYYPGGRCGYGIHISGSERVLIRNIRGDRCKHVIDLGQLSTSHPVPRHIVVDGGQFDYTYGAAFGSHNVQDYQIKNVTMRGCNGGIHVRGGDVAIEGYRFYGGKRSIPTDIAAGGYTLEIGAGIFIGEESSKTEPDTRGGPAGTRLTVKDCIIDAPWVGSGSDYNQNFRGFDIVDPLIDSYIEATISTSGDAFWADGDKIIRNTINLKIDRTQQTSGKVGVFLGPGKPPDGGTVIVPQEVSDNHITVLMHGGTSGGPGGAPGPAIQIGGGLQGGVSRHNIINLSVPTLATGQTASTPQVVFDGLVSGQSSTQAGGSYGTNYFQSLLVPQSNETTVITEASGATNVFSNFTKYKFSTASYPTIVNSSVNFRADSGANVLKLGMPADYADGDYLLAVLISQGSDVSADPTLPSGWAAVGPTSTTSSSTMRYNGMFGKTVSGTQPADFTFTFGTGVTNNRTAGAIFLIRGGGSIASSGSGSANYSGASPVTALTFNSITATSNSAVFAATHTTTASGADGVVAVPSGWSEVAKVVSTITPGSTSADTLQVFYKSASSTVSSFTTATNQSTIAANATFSVALAG